MLGADVEKAHCFVNLITIERLLNLLPAKHEEMQFQGKGRQKSC